MTRRNTRRIETLLAALVGACCLSQPAATAATLVATAPQDRPGEPTLEEKIERYLIHVRSGSAVIRPQAARRLASLGEPAAKRILELCGNTNDKLALLGPSLIEIFGQFGDAPSGAKLRAKLWPMMDDPEFPWRPAASRSLATAPEAPEFERFAAFMEDPIAPVRFACLDALFALTEPDGGDAADGDAPDGDAADGGQDGGPAASLDRALDRTLNLTLGRRFLELAAERLHDESDIVRRQAAVLLDRRGHGNALLWLLEDLQRSDSFFGMPTGQAARYGAMDELTDVGIDLGAYDPEKPITSLINRKELRSIGEQIRERARKTTAALPEAERGLVPAAVPPIAQAGEPVDDAVLGLQLKSCRRGDYDLRWTSEDVLVIGYGNPVRIQLAEGTTRALVEVANRTQEAVEGRVYWGQPGCDMEGYHMPRLGEPDGRPQILTISKNEGPIADLRPGALTELGAAMAATIPSDETITTGDPRARALAARVRGAFASIGGPLRR